MSPPVYLDSITPGEDWTLGVERRDSNDQPVEMQAPGYMDLRLSPNLNGERIARIDSTGTADGTLSFDVPGRVNIILPASFTTTLPIDRTVFFDLFVSGSDTRPFLVLSGRVHIKRVVSRVAP